jgi:4-alpha-glucanotransferase
MPPYRWDRIAAKSYDLILERLNYAAHFYDLFRIDHAVGMFRIWTIPVSEPLENGGRNGVFRPEEEGRWEAHGRELLSVMAAHTTMLPCAEDLGTVPECSPRTLHEFGIPGLDVQRWMKEEQADFTFQSPERYRTNSISLLSTHDMMPFAGWWEYEAGTVDEALFDRKCGEAGILFTQVRDRLFDLERSSHGRLRWKDEITSPRILADVLGRRETEIGFLILLYRESYGEKNKFWSYTGFTGTPEEKFFPLLARRALERTAGAASIFSIQGITDWLALGDSLSAQDPAFFRINTPGIISEANWSCVLPLSLEEIRKLPLTGEIREINRRAGRV